MDNLLIIGSTAFAPLADVAALLDYRRPPLVTTWGNSPIAREVSRLRPDSVVIAATNHRTELIDAAQTPGTRTVALVAKDPETKAVSAGTDANIALLQTNGVDVEIVSSSLTANQAAIYHAVEIEYLKLLDTPPARSTYRINRLLPPLGQLDQACADLETALREEDERLREGDAAETDNDRWIRSLRRLETMRRFQVTVANAIATRQSERAAVAA